MSGPVLVWWPTSCIHSILYEPHPPTYHGPSPVYKALPQLEAEHPELGLCLANLCNPRSQARSRLKVDTWCSSLPNLTRGSPEKEGRRESHLGLDVGCQTWWFCEPPAQPSNHPSA